jgi:hypothetical protein
VERAIQHGRIGNAEEAPADEVERQEDDLGFVAGLRLAVPLGLGLWAILIWCIVTFVL